ncbi:hypothetical protein OD91_0878 [Lutibacter sp. Hel_I_33_5]|uniref:hypothetical protein n=1 Tax=Lutibacter sp. Hel_I_33_5 TaxID=1566289 RepID=UPI0011A84823|nr:hypothetical protein [Lutibacter sp. Hel_I_33_5]TVZ55623.1 hypothetical protein OD91_0878 [Lutibacter sp. Hel_I_33_5]
MKQPRKCLNLILKKYEKSDDKRAVLKVYLTVVMLHNSIAETAKFFKLSDKKVVSAVTVCGVRLQKDRFFEKQLKAIFNEFFFDNQLKLSA